MKYLIRLIGLAIILQGCASIEEGEVDYVRTIANKAIDSKTNANCSTDLYAISEYSRAGFTRECYETLYRKYTKVPEIKKGDTVSVHLMQAFNGFAKESQTLSEFFRNVGSNAEMVVIVNVCEQGVPGCSLRFGPESDKSGRVIFYSNGVKAKQYLNFSYLPVYGPIKYQGGPLILQISILELDNLSEQQKNLLTTLAEAGKKSYPPASEALSVLEKVGSSLMAGSSDDIIFRYTMSLVPASSKQNYQSPIIAEGNYAFIRKNTGAGALENEVTDELKFDNLTGRLVQKCKSDEKETTTLVDGNGKKSAVDYNPCTLEINTGSNFKDYRDNTYLTFQIKSGFSESTLDNIQTFEALLGDINAEKDAGALKMIDAFTDLKKEVSRNSQQNKLLKKLDDVKKSLANIPEDTFGLYENQVFQLFDEYNRQTKKYNNEPDCSLTPLPESCEVLMTPEQLVKVQLEARSLLNLINPAIDPLNSIPSGYSDLPEKFKEEFKNGYHKYFNEVSFQRYLGEVDSIMNLADNIQSLKINNEKSEYIKARQDLFKGQIKHFLSQLSKDLTLKTALSCNDIHAGTCYRYLTSDQTIEVTTIFNQFARNYGLNSDDDLTSSAKSVSENIKIIQSFTVLQ